MTSPVDYEREGGTYAQCRALDDLSLSSWRTAIASLCRIEAATVVDVGSGTGIFTRAWAQWGARVVIGCEPSDAMRTEASRSGAVSGIAVVAARAEHLPLATAVADVVWASTVVHHIGDLHAWASETCRILRSGGTLLVRNLFADLGTVSWAAALPGTDRAREAFPTVHSLAELLGQHGLTLVSTQEVSEHNADQTSTAAAAWIRTMRRADTFLLALSDAEIDQGLARLDSHPPGHLLGPTSLGLVAFVHQG